MVAKEVSYFLALGVRCCIFLFQAIEDCGVRSMPLMEQGERGIANGSYTRNFESNFSL